MFKRLLLSILALGLATAAKADSLTPRVGATLITIGSTEWGPKVNTNMSIFDTSAAVQGQPNTFTAQNTFQAPVIIQSTLTVVGSTVTAAYFIGNGQGLTSLNASELTSGTLPAARIGAASIDTTKLAADSVTSTQLLNGAVTTAKLADSAVDTSKLASDAVTTPKLLTAAVTTPKIADSAVDTSKLATDAVSTAKILNAAVDTNKLATDAVSTAKLLNSAVTTAKIADAAVDTAKLATDAVSNAKILNAAVDTNKLATDSVSTGKLLNQAVTTAKIADAAVDTSKLASESVTTAKLADSAVTTAKINNAAVDTNKLATDSVTTAKVLNANITTAKLADAAVDTSKLASDAVTTAKIADAAVDTNKLATASVTTAKLADAAVDTNKLASDSVTTAKILNSNVTAAKLASGAAASNVGSLGGDLTGTLPNPTVAAAAIDTTKLATDAVTTAKILNQNVTTAKIADAAVDTSKLATDSVTTAKLINSAVDTSKLATDSVSTAKLLNSAVTTAKIADAAVDTSKLANDSVTSAKIADNAVTTAEINNAAVDTNKLATDSVTTAKILNAAVDTSKLATDSVTTAKLINSAVDTSKLATDAVTAAKLLSSAASFNKVSGGAATSDGTNIGIGTTTPTMPLEVYKAGVGNIMTLSGEPGIGRLYFQTKSNGTALYGYTAPVSQGKLYLGAGGTDTFEISNTSGTLRGSLGVTSNATVGGVLTMTGANGNGATDAIIDNSVSNVGNSQRIRVDNSDNTNGASHAIFYVQTGGGSGGDPYVQFNNRVQNWAMGMDNSDSDKFKLSFNPTLGTNDYLTVTSAGTVGIGTASPDSYLHVKGGVPVHAIIDGTSSSNKNADIQFAINGTPWWSEGIDPAQQNVSDWMLREAQNSDIKIRVSTGVDTGVYIKGSRFGDLPPAGYVGEVSSKTLSGNQSIGASASFVAISTVALTDGNWLCNGWCYLTGGGTTAGTQVQCSISATNNGLETVAGGGYYNETRTVGVNHEQSYHVGPRRISIGDPVTYYLIAALSYTTLGGAQWTTQSRMECVRIP